MQREGEKLIFYFNSICHVVVCLHSKQSDAAAAGDFSIPLFFSPQSNCTK